MGMKARSNLNCAMNRLATDLIVSVARCTSLMDTKLVRTRNAVSHARVYLPQERLQLHLGLIAMQSYMQSWFGALMSV